MNQLLEKQLIECAQAATLKNKRYHDFGHSIEVMRIAKKIQENNGGDLDVIIPASLFHDISNTDNGDESASFAEKILLGISSFSKIKIEKVKLAIKATTSGQYPDIESLIVDDADQLSSMTELGLIRSVMFDTNKGFSLKETIDEINQFIHKKYNSFSNLKKNHTEYGRKLAVNMYPNIQKILTRILENYNS